MHKKLYFFLITILMAFSVVNFVSCRKDPPPAAPAVITPPPAPDPCAGKTITISAATTVANCTSDGTITVTATGSTGFTYKLNAGGTYQPSNIFTGLAAGAYTVFAKDVNGCENSAAATVGTNNTAGPLFTNVRSLLNARCVSCHNNTFANGGANWQVDCNIVSLQARINQRAVVEGTMPAGGPPLSASEKAIITNWIAAGGKFTD